MLVHQAPVDQAALCQALSRCSPHWRHPPGERPHGICVGACISWSECGRPRRTLALAWLLQSWHRHSDHMCMVLAASIPCGMQGGTG